MRVIPIDQSRVSTVFVECVMKTDQTGIQKRERDTDVPLWALRCLIRVIGDPSRPEIVEVTVPSRTDLGQVLDPLTPVTFSDFGAMAWSIDGKSGVAYSASSVKHAGDAKVRPSTNGAKAEVPA